MYVAVFVLQHLQAILDKYFFQGVQQGKVMLLTASPIHLMTSRDLL